jgi:hypothetical protein
MEPLPGRRWRLARALVYQSVVANARLYVPRGFECDGNSLPRLAWLVALPTDYAEAGMVHDWLYRQYGYSRQLADRVYREALQVLGMGWWRRNLRYCALRMAGWWAYRTAQRTQHTLHKIA